MVKETGSVRTLAMRIISLLVLVVLASATYTADEARKRYERAVAARAPLDAMVKLITDHVRDRVSADVKCARVGLGSWDEIPELVAIKAYPEWKQALRGELEKLGYTIKEIVGSRRPVTCACAKPPPDLEDGGFFAACSMACSEHPYVELCWA